MRRAALLLLIALFLATAVNAQSTSVSGTITSSDGQAWIYGSYRIEFYPGSSGGPFFWNGNPFNSNTSFAGALDGTGSFTGVSVPSNAFIAPAGTAWRFTVCPAANSNCYSTILTVNGSSQNVSSSIIPPPVQVIANSYNQPVAYADSEIVGPQPGFLYYNIAMQVNRQCQGPLPCTWVSISGGGGGTPASPSGCVQFNISSAFGTIPNLCVDSVVSPTLLTIPLNLNVGGDVQLKGPNPYFDIRQYGARGVVINTTGTGSGTSLTVPPATGFIIGDGITIAQGGAAPSITTPVGLSVAPGLAAGLTVADVPTVNTTGGTTYQYTVFAHDILGGATAPAGTVTTTTGPSSLGENQVAISTWSLTGTTLTITTSAANGFVQNAEVHITGTSNNALAGGWYPIGGITNSNTFVINNVPQSSSTTVSGTGGLATVFTGNAITWNRQTGTGKSGPWDVFVCAKRPGDSSFHIVGRSFPTTLYGEIYVSNRFVDFGSTLSSNPIIPWYLSNANCTAGAAQNELFTTTVTNVGGTTITLASPLTNSVASVAVRLDNAPAFKAAATAAVASEGALYIPVGQTFQLNSVVFLPSPISIWQAGELQLVDTLVVGSSTNWSGQDNVGGGGGPQFGFNSGPLISCFAYPCVYAGGVGGETSGSNTYTDLIFDTPTQNGLDFLADGGWGQIWDKVNFISGAGNNDNMGIGLMIRPGASSYKIRNSNFGGGPAQIIDQSWAPMFFMDQAPAGCCGGSGSVGTVDFDNNDFAERGIYEIANGGPGVVMNIHGLYRQGGITPMYTLQNITGNLNGQVSMDFVEHDTESQAAYAWICNIGCSGGSGVPFHLGFTNPISQDAGTIPGQITGGGNQGVAQIVATLGPGSLSTFAAGVGWTYLAGALNPTANITMSGPFGSYNFTPNVPTPDVCLQSASLCGDLVPTTLTAHRTYTFPDASGTVCITTTCGGQFYQTVQDNAVAQTQRPILNVIPGANMTITCADNAGATRTDCTFISSSTASTAWASITAGTNSNPGTFTATGNTWNFSGASGFSLPSGTTIPGSGSGQVTLAAQSAAGTPTVTFGTSSGTPAVTASSPLAITTATGNITCATCATTTNGGALSGVAPISISVAGAISISAATTGALGSVELAGDLAGTATSVTVVSTHIASASTNTLMKANATGNMVNTALVEASSLLTISESVDLQANATISEVANASSTGTTVHKLASLTAAPSTAVITTAGSTSGALGIVVGGAGTTGNAQVAVSGQATCVYDGATTAGDYVQISAGTNGDCTDAGSTPPSSGQVIGLVLTTNVGGGTYNTFLFGPAGGSGGGGGSGTVNTCAAFATHPLANYTGSTAVSCDANITVSAGALTLGITGSAAGSLVLSGSASGAVTLQVQAAAGTFNWNYPITAGTSTFVLTSAGGGSSPMTWTSPTITVDGQSCTLGSTCTTVTVDTNGSANTSQNLIDFRTSVSNTIGLTNTPVNPSGGRELFEISGVLTPSGGGTGVPSPTAHSLLMAEGSANMTLITSPSLNGNYICGFNVTASAAVDVSCNLLGVPVLTPATPYTGLFSDRATVQLLSGGSTFSWTAPQITGNTASNFPVVFINNNSGILTFTANAADKVNGGSLGGTYATPTLWATFMYQDNSTAPGNWWPLTVPLLAGLPASCGDTGGNHVNIVSGVWSCGTSTSSGGGTVTSIATTSPITGGTITTSGTIACATCVTSAAALTNTAIVIGGGLQASSTDTSATLSGGALTLASGGSVTLNGSSSGSFALSVNSSASTLNLGASATLTSAGVLTVTSCSGCSAAAITLSSITAATGGNTIANGNNGGQVWNWAQTSNSQTAFTFGETSAATGTSDIELAVTTAAGSTAIPVVVTDSLTGSQTLAALKITPTWNTSGVVDAALLVNVTNTASGTGSLLADFQVGGTSQFKVDKAGNLTVLGALAGGSLSVTGSAAMGQFNLAETTAPSGAASTDICYGDSTLHGIKCSFNNGSFSAVPLYNGFAALTDGATITWAIGSVASDSKTLVFTTHGGSRTLNITNPINAGSYVLTIKQDATGGEGLTLGSGCTWKVSNGGAGAITPSTGASAIDILAFTYDSTTSTCYANFNKNFN